MAEPADQNSANGTDPKPTPEKPDNSADINSAIAAERKKFKDATGFDSLEAFNENRLKEQGKLQELIDVKAKAADQYKAKFENSQIKTALLSAAADAIDPSDIIGLLTGNAACDENGNVTINGKSAADAVKQLLTDKPHLARPQGGTGSGAPAKTTPAEKNPWSTEHFNLTDQIRIKNENPALAAQLKAASGK